MKIKNSKNILLTVSILSTFLICDAVQVVDKDYTTNKNCRWVKVSNDETSAIDITLYKVLDSTASSSGHGVTLTSQNPNKMLEVGESATISNGDIVCGYSGKVYRSAISTAGTVSGVVPYFIGIKSPNTTIVSNATSSDAESTITSSVSNGSAVRYNSDYIRKTFTFGDLALLSPRDVIGVAGGATEFWVKAIDSKNNSLISNVVWSFGDGSGASGATTSHRYVYPGSYIGTIDVETNLVYGFERVNVKIVSPNLAISEVLNTSDGSSITIRNNSDDEIDIGGFVLSMNTGFFKLSKHLIIPPLSDIKLSGETLGFKRADNIRLLFENNAEVTRYEPYKSVASITPVVIGQVLGTSSKIIVKKSPKINYNYIPKKKIAIATTTKTETVVPVLKKNTVEKGVDSTWHKWLYWLYD